MCKIKLSRKSLKYWAWRQFSEWCGRITLFTLNIKLLMVRVQREGLIFKGHLYQWTYSLTRVDSHKWHFTTRNPPEQSRNTPRHGPMLRWCSPEKIFWTQKIFVVMFSICRMFDALISWCFKQQMPHACPDTPASTFLTTLIILLQGVRGGPVDHTKSNLDNIVGSLWQARQESSGSSVGNQVDYFLDLKYFCCCNAQIFSLLPPQCLVLWEGSDNSVNMRHYSNNISRYNNTSH